MSAKAFEPYQLAGKRKAVTDAVHAEDGVIFAQLMHSGRIGHPGLQDLVVPQELDEADILATIEDFASAARNAIDAGFDGVELHGANGYLIHQFLSAHTNRRDDRWGNGVSGRIRFAVEVARATSRAIGADKVGIRISPGTAVNDINDDPDHEATFLPLVRELAALNLAYLHLAERAGRELTGRIRAAWPHTLVLNPDTGATPTGPDELRLVEDGPADLLAFGAHFIANPDLPHRLATGAPLTPGDRGTFFGGGDQGYIDYPTLN